MFDFVTSNTVINYDINTFLKNIDSTLFTKYSEDYIHQLQQELKIKFHTNKHIFIDNGSSAIINKIIMEYDCFHIQENDFYLFEELIKNYNKDYKKYSNETYLEEIKQISDPGICLFTLVNNITGKNYLIDDIILISRKKPKIKFIIDGAYLE